MKSFQAPKIALGQLDAEAVATLVAAAADISLVLDAAGIIRDVAFSSDDLLAEFGQSESWIGRPWIDTVARDSRPKVQDMLRAPQDPSRPRWRHVNQLGAGGASVPILCTCSALDKSGGLVVFGRNLRSISQLQQRLVEVQQSVERGYSQLRQAETRYRLLFQTSEDAVLIVEGDNGKVLEANPAAQRLFGTAARRLVGRPVAESFAIDSREGVLAMLASLRGVGRAGEVEVRLADGDAPFRVTGTTLRHDNGLVFLVRLSPVSAQRQPAGIPEGHRNLLRLAENAPDALVVTDSDGAILTANAAFLDMAQLTSEEQLRGESLDRWLGRQGLEADVLLSNLRNRGAVRLYATTLRGRLGTTLDVEISAVSVMEGSNRRYGFAIRDVSARLKRPPNGAAVHGRSVQELTELVGRVPLKDLVREAADAIERLCIEAALEITGDNRASAAEMLGLSRQSLYVKLHRFGLGDLDADPKAPR
ncbi:transcriptional regulator PpsR [Humitalea sp. 24SJ18S-53]|uniref:transcriptional regulator PpsR n=1 Tax=Humitalea sp. 24SJ18S-53 TaxID=3422307 RepID=UPI003D67A011